MDTPDKLFSYSSPWMPRVLWVAWALIALSTITLLFLQISGIDPVGWDGIVWPAVATLLLPVSIIWSGKMRRRAAARDSGAQTPEGARPGGHG